MDLELGLKLRERRKEKRLTLAELGEMSGMDKTYLGRIECGKRSPSAHTLRKLAAPLGYGEAEILKLGGYLSPDGTDDRIDTFKESLKSEIRSATDRLLERVDSM